MLAAEIPRLLPMLKRKQNLAAHVLSQWYNTIP